mgnify:CR=1 FL=1
MKMVVTKVKLKPGSTESCAQLFRETNPDLVRDQPDWLGACMMVDQDNDMVTVMASWRDATSYEALAKSEAFQATMARFVGLFASPPEITVNDVVVEMTPENIVND